MSQCVSAVASIEIPENQWPEIIDTLSTHVTHEERNIRLASIQTIGYICEEIDEEEHFSQEPKEVIISAIINCINGNKDDIVLTNGLL